MKRRDILKTASLAGIASLLPFGKSRAAEAAIYKIRKEAGVESASCVLIPQETAGPYPWDLSGNSAMYRQDITEGNAGIPLNLTLTLVNTNDNCNPISNARVDIWHCNKDGYYSEYANQPGYLGTMSYLNQTFFRGIQLSDGNGVVEFTTIYPGWYTGRVTHIHIEVFLNSVLSATTQLAFPDTLTTAVYNTSLYSAHGQNTTTNETDNVFSDMSNTQYELLDVSSNASTGGYNASLTVGVAVPTTGLINLEPETGGQFKLGVNYPNPFETMTTIPFSLLSESNVRIEIFDTQGRKITTVIDQKMSAGAQKVNLDRSGNVASLSTGNYLYVITVTNSTGTFRQAKLLTMK